MSHGKIEFSKFTIVGGINFLFTFVLFYLFVRVWELNYIFALVTVSLLGMVLTYCLNRVWVFKLESRNDHGARLFKYILSGVASIALNAVVLRYIVEKGNFDPFYVQIGLIPFVVILNFSMAKFWSLRRNID
ncbi:MAG: GtrA family protein [Pseudomonadales bacterium]